ncbi:MAG: outer membrane protein assembly factor BamA [Proteobacteria bacterium]|nr:outer membrane protein assembly factor BamA [Pseudomonadota bacterium]
MEYPFELHPARRRLAPGRGSARGALARRVAVLLLLGAPLLALPAAAADAVVGGRVSRVAIQGNRRVESDAIRAVLGTRVGNPLSPQQLASDVQAIWRLGYFDDVRVGLFGGEAARIVVFLLREKPAIAKIFVSGNDEIELEKINEALDLQRGAILNIAQVKRNVEKIRELYIEKGFYLAEVSYRLRRVADERVDILLKVTEHAKVTIRRITFIGNRRIPAAELAQYMETREGGHFSFVTSSGTYKQQDLERDMAAIAALYYDRGFVNVRIADPLVVLSPDRRYMYLTIHIREGETFRLGRVDVKGDLLWPRAQLLRELKVRPGETFSRSRLGLDVVELTNRYKNRGYAYANLTPLTNIDADKRVIDLTFEVQKGPVVTIERINVLGNSKTRDKVIRRELRIAEGDRFNQSQIDRSLGRVRALGYFESADLSTERGTADDRIVINLEVRERPTGTFQIGAGFSSVENFIAQAQVSQENLFGRGQRLSLQAQVSGLRQMFALSFSEPYFIDSRWTFGFEVYNSLRVFESFDRNAVGGTLTWGYPVLEDVHLFASYRGEQVDVTTRGRRGLFGAGLSQSLPSGVRLANLFNDGFTSSARVTLQWDRRNNRLFPSKGFFQAAWVEAATNLLGSQNRFNRYGAFSRWYYPLFGPMILKLNGQIGVITSPDPNGVPIFERFFTGGIFDVRGFRPRSLGPRVFVLESPSPNARLFAFNKGGNKELVLNAEVEFPIFEKVVAFAASSSPTPARPSTTISRSRWRACGIAGASAYAGFRRSGRYASSGACPSRQKRVRSRSSSSSRLAIFSSAVFL